MIVSEIQITLKSFGGNPVVHVVPFSSMDWAEKEYATLKELVKRMDDHANDLPKRIEVVGEGAKAEFALSEVQSFGLVDFERSNNERVGMHDKFPHLFKR